MKWSRQFEEDSDVFVEKHAYISVEVVDTEGVNGPDDKHGDRYVVVLLAFDPEQVRDPMGILVAAGPSDGYEFGDWVADEAAMAELGFRLCREESVPTLVIEP